MPLRLKDESGMAMGIVIIMLVLIGVLSAGLLTFVRTDLTTVVEVNQGERAFELADAGVQAAVQQLKVPLNANASRYNGGGDDFQWSEDPSKGGVTLNDLDGNAATSDNVLVTIKTLSTPANSFLVTSTGTYGEARRKIEAILRKTSSPTSSSGIPAYYTPGNITLKDDVTINGISLFSGRNIIVDPVSPRNPARFKVEYEDSGGTLKIGSTADRLGDWNTTDDVPSANWNTVGRKDGASPFAKVGFAAEGKICGSSSCASSDPSIADGVRGYDSTTFSKGNNLKFARKTNCSSGAEEPTRAPNGTDCGATPRNVITYPFGRITPDAERLKLLAETQSDGSKYLNYASGPINWSALYPNANADRVVFIDANGSTINFDSTNEANNQGVLVVRCGQLVMSKKFQGVVINLKGTSPDNGSGCGDKGIYRSAGQDLTGYVYAEGGVGDVPGIALDTGSKLSFLPSPENVLNLAFGPASKMMEVASWRELYE